MQTNTRDFWQETIEAAAEYAEAALAYVAGELEPDDEEDEDRAAVLGKLRDAYPDRHISIEYTLSSNEYLRLELFDYDTTSPTVRRAVYVRHDFPNHEEIQFTDQQADAIAAALGII